MFNLSKLIADLPDAATENDEQPVAQDEEPKTMTEAKAWYNMQTTHHFFVGDESTVELFNALKTIALQNNHEYFGVLELHPDYEAVLAMLKLLVDSVPEHPDQPAQNAIHWMDDMHPHCWHAWSNATFYLSGGTTLISHFREYLLQRSISNKQIRIIKL